MRRRDDLAIGGLIDSYGAQGGLTTTDELIVLMRPHWRQPISMPAKWIVDQRLVSFSWRGQLLLPPFQFARPRMTPHQGVSESMIELADCMENHRIALWFVEPSVWLLGARSVELLLSNPDAIVDAAVRTRMASPLRGVRD